MTYVIVLILAVLVALIYIIFYNNKKTEENILEDIPVIDVNKEDLEKHALEISNHYSSSKNINYKRKLIKNLDKRYSSIIKGYEYIDKDVRSKKEVAPAAEWLLDNLYLVEKEYKHIKQNMPEKYYKNLPVIDRGIMKGYPRIYNIAVELVSHTDGKMDEDTIEKFIKAYQTNTVLTSGELWALPIMLRIALIQNISKITENIVFSQQEKRRADTIADRLIDALSNKKIEEELEKIANEDILFTCHFTERLLKVLRDNGVDYIEAYKWIDEKLEIQETNSEKMINLEHHKQADYQFSMGNCINSIREVEAINWRESFEKVSIVENILKKDPANIYDKMDFESRDYYRHRIEEIAKNIKKPESFVAKKAVECAVEANEDHDRDYEKHVGYYIVDKGTDCLKTKSNFKDKGIKGTKNNIKKHAIGYYIGTIIVFTVITMAVFMVASYFNDTERILWRYIIAAAVLLIPCSEIVISILNWNVNHLTTPKLVPKIEFKEGLGEKNRTIVVIPTIINNVNKVHELVNNMEVYFLGNRDRNLYFALLSDFKDSSIKTEKEDKEIVKAALKEIKKLNKKYAEDREDIFYFFSRYRQYNEKEGKWLGWERKRGKLMEFNQLIRGNNKTSYDVISGDISKLKKAKYVITLDCDTQLPRDSAKKLIGAMAHILNIPHIEKDKKRVVRGYGIMQPRISVGTVSANKTLFSRIFSGETGIDTYTTAVSDVYQDLFQEGIFTGKGIYEIDVFNHMLNGGIPENSILSHDLLEGEYTRCALVTDIELIDGYPAYYNASTKRLHRWVRGDWQLLPWFNNRESLRTLSKFKMLDNLRRSLLAPSIILLFALSFNFLPDGTDKWIIAAILALLCPLLFDVTETVISPIRGISLSGKIKDGKNVVEQVFLIFCFLPYTAYLMVDAIIRTVYRLSISKKNLLEWQPAADVEAKSGKNLSNYVSSMWPSSLISVVILLAAFSKSPNSGIFMIPSCALWFINPYIAYYISKDAKKEEFKATASQEKMLRRISRKTWAYFEDFVNEKDNWLAPDNYQVNPPNGVARRTSPTNIAMGLTSNLTAYDLGYIGLEENLQRLKNILKSMDKLKKYKGHFYNWYDTETMNTLNPEYISTVDSGNLVGYLWLLGESLEEYKNIPLINKNMMKGICDTLSLANEEISKELGLEDTYRDIIKKISSANFDIVSWKKILSDIFSKAVDIEKSQKDKKLYWNNKVKNTAAKALGEMQRVLPWIDLVTENRDEIGELYGKLNSLALQTPLNSFVKETDNLVLKSKKYNNDLQKLLSNSKVAVEKVLSAMEELKQIAVRMSEDTDFTMLYDKQRGLFAIGYDVEKDSLGKSYYDLLASEARQASFVAIAKGDIDQKHWFKLGRAMTIMGKSKGLVSWSGTMFEYLMPLLIMKAYPDTLLDATYKAVVEGQKKYCRSKKVPWGVSESAFRSFDVSKNYQYKAFGIPGIGLKRGLVNELVISPYSTVMALQVDAQGAIYNMERLIGEGLEDRYGFYEAVDYTKDRIPKGNKNSIVKCFMVHHEGMSLMALDNVLKDNILQKRFHNISKVKATELLLQEKVPNRIVYEREHRFEASDMSYDKQNIMVRKFNTANTDMPETHLLSNGSYSMMISNSGSGYGKKEDMTIYRWKEDVTLDSSGMFFYIKNVKDNKYWSNTYEPCKNEGDKYEVIFSLDKAEFKREDRDISTYTEIAVSNEDDAEVRRISIANHGNETKIIEITSYCEVTLAPLNSDIVHPAFGNLFIRTEFIQNPECVIANRRPRAKGQKKPFVIQTIALKGTSVGTVQYETSRVNFTGRGKNLTFPNAMEGDTPLQNTVGAVLDPIISMRKRVRIEPGETCIIAYTTAVADSKEDAIEIAEKYRELNNVNRAFELALTQNAVEMKYLGIKSLQANLYQSMASKILYLSPLFEERSEYIRNIKRGQSSLWKYGISGDIPIVLAVVKENKHKDMIRQMLNAHEYWSIKGLKVDLVILNLQETAYTQPLQDSIRDVIATSHARDKQNKSGGVFLYNKATIEKEDIDLLMAISKLVIEGDKGLVVNQIKTETKQKKQMDLLPVVNRTCVFKSYKFIENKLYFFNDIGGFDLENDQYVIKLKNGKNTPAPWINVVSNRNFGFHVSESGSAYTWYKNSRENKITTWSNDWVSDTPSEAAYLRDEESGDIWSITAKPIRDSGEYIIEHGFGYSNFKHEAYGIVGEMTMFVPKDDNVKLCEITLKNNSTMDRRLSLTYYAQTVLGVVPQHTSIHIATSLNNKKKYISAQNPYSEHFGNLHAYLKIAGGEEESFTGDRKEFIGRGRSIEDPEALKRVRLSNTTGGGYDPCLCQNVKFTIKAGEEKTLIVMLGEDESIEAVEKVIGKYEDIKRVEEELKNVKDYWEKLLHTIKVKTPDRTMDIMLNGWLLYQTIVCRIWARSAFYQSGGAYGFRDQLQDMMAVAYVDPNMTREHIIYSASRQFLEGDVQHWWHPGVDSGIRTRFSDDLLWLPYVTADYIKRTGDYSILDEEAYYLEDKPLAEGEDERYTISKRSDKKGSIYEHCIKAIERGLKFGPHNIPLMGSGDWNDGMSEIGNKGKGESVWLGWFLYSILDDFKEICKVKGDEYRVQRYDEMKDFIQENLEKNAWDGNWYRRAYFDDGSPLGSIENDECQIDSLSQSWAIISKAGDKKRIKEAMNALEKYLIKEDIGMVFLLTPPFENGREEPGYIKGYVPGVRENGGQYTHAATWVVLAMTELGYGDKAWKIYNMLNPINHTKSYYGCERYKVEPYVMTADVYGREPHIGRGGWSWYTGTSGWMYRVAIEGILGLKFKGEKGFVIEPTIPKEWNEFEIEYNRGECKYIIKVTKGEQEQIKLDGKVMKDNIIPYLESGVHQVEVAFKSEVAAVEEWCNIE
ncbi:GH36-type glycosyl hydrolase domain-containing protein [Clostridium sp. ZS2-4]|uniref:GH36-type glycosyl hydrolase domain-containing protein n=1 Tax=Clostridium sp. ZS2-4 TaxID=2987703 RepID=UPI00227AAED7|nr:glucoamylase family protein [Clostridium sp. ZS2-4]MCY6356795.1 cyclic beta 1-2 glucan synthetase [Clostridium sp. ZS2-4]